MKMDNYNDFLAGIESYYKPYNNHIRKNIILKYLKRNFKVDILSFLYANTLLHYTSTFAKTPDIAIFEEVKNKYNIPYGKSEDYQIIDNKIKETSTDRLTKEELKAERRKAGL